MLVGMDISRLLVPGLLGALVMAPSVARAGDDSTSSVRGAYLALRDGGCDVSQIGSPIVARVLRNVPYAMKGKIFTSPELSYVYGQDGGWYQPSSAKAEVDAGDRACVKALGAQETKLRKRVKLKKPIEEAITRHPGVVLEMSQTVLPDFKKFSQAQKTVDGKRQWTINFEAGGGAALVTVTCQLPEAEAKAKAPDWSKLECNLLAAG